MPDTFGLPTEDDQKDQDWLMAGLTSPEDPAATPEAPAGQTAGETPAATPAPAPDPAIVGPEPQQVPEATPAATPAETEAQKLYAGKYKDVPALEKGYVNVRDAQRRAAERANAAERQLVETNQRMRLLETEMQRAIPLLRQAMQPRPQAPTRPADPWSGVQEQPEPQSQTLSPEQIALLADQLAAERVAQSRGEWQAEAEAQMARQAQEQTVRSFWGKHNIVEGDEQDNAMFDSVQTLNDAWDNAGWEVDLSNPDTLDIVYETTQSPELLQVLQLNPDYIESDAGMQLARFQAALLRGEPITQATSTGPASQVGQRAPQAPVTERASVGTAGTAAGQQKPLDEFEEAVMEFRRNNKRGLAGSVFG
jgi:hypothetical protein